MKHLEGEPTRSILLINLPRVAGCQVSQLKAEICDVLTEETSGKVTNIRYSRLKACAVVTFSTRMPVVKALQRGRQGRIFVCGTRVKLFRTPDPVLTQTKEKKQHLVYSNTNSKQHNTWQERTESAAGLCYGDTEIDSYMYLPFHKDPFRPQHISEDICSRIVVPKSQRSNQKRKKLALFSKLLSKCYSSKKQKFHKKTGKQKKKTPKKKATTVPKRYTIYVQGLSTLIPVQVKSNDTIAVLKAAIKQKEGIKIPVRATLWCKGYKLVDLLTLDDQLVGPESNVTLQLGLKGGSDKDQSASSPRPNKDSKALQGRSEDTLSGLVTEQELLYLAKNLGAEWESLAIALGMKKADVYKFKVDNPHNTEQAIVAMLVKWKEIQGLRATKHHLREMLMQEGIDEECFDFIIRDMAQSAAVPSSLHATSAKQDSLRMATTTGFSPPEGADPEEWLVDTLHHILNPKNEPNCKPMTLKDLGTKFDNMKIEKKFKGFKFGSMKQFIENHKKQFELREKKGMGLMVVGKYLKKKKRQKAVMLHQKEEKESIARREEDLQMEVEAKSPCSSESTYSVVNSEGEQKPNRHKGSEKTTVLDVCLLTDKDVRKTMEEHQPRQSVQENEQTLPIPVTFPEKSMFPSIPPNQFISKQVEIWSVDEVCSWLQTLNLNKDKLTAYFKTFCEEDITGKALLNLSESARKDLGMSIGDWTEVKSEIEKLKTLTHNQPPQPDIGLVDDQLQKTESHDGLVKKYRHVSAERIWDDFLHSVDNFQSSRAYCLIVDYTTDKETAEQQQEPNGRKPVANLSALANINWTKVFDFDPNSKDSGILTHCEEPLRNRRGLYISTCQDHPKDLSDKATEWFFPILDAKASVTKWTNAVGKKLNAHCEKLAQFCYRKRPLTVVVLWYGKGNLLSHLHQLLLKIGENVSNSLRIVLCLKDSEVRKSVTTLCHDFEIENVFEIPLEYLCLRLSQVGSSKTSHNKYILPLLSDKKIMEVEIEPKDAAWLAEELEVLYIGQNHKPDDLDDSKLGNDFYRGGQISWYELQLGNFDVQRDLAQKLETLIVEYIGNHKSAKLTLYHAPGAGGSTLARRTLWNLHRNKIDPCVCVFVTNISHDTSPKIVWLHKKTHLPVLVVDDCRVWKAESLHIEQMFQFCHRYTQLLILDVQRFVSRIDADSKGDTFWLKGEVSEDEAIRLKTAFAHNCPTKEKQLQKLVKDVKSGRPHHVYEFGLAAYEYDFKGVQSYVSGYLKYDSSEDMLPWQQVVSFLALAFYYGHAQISGQFFAGILHINCKDVVDYDDLPYEARKFVCTDEWNNWRITLHVVAKEILEQVLCPKQHKRELGIRLSKDARHHLEKLAISFVKEAGSHRSSGDRVSSDIVQIVRATFFQRHNNEILLGGQKKNLSPLLVDIPSKQPYTERLKILTLLTESFPKNPHCFAHLGRFYAYERAEFERAKENIEKALQICQEEEFSKHYYHSTNDEFSTSQDFNEMESQSKSNLSLVYNMKGCVYLAEMSKLVGRLGSANTYGESTDIDAVIKEALALARIASDAFVKCREHYRQGYEQEVGYVPDIELRLMLLEFIQKNSYNGGYRQYIDSENVDIFIEEALGTIDTLIRECQDKVPTLTNAFYRCVDWFYVLFDDAARAVKDWHDVSTVRGRRGKIAAYRMKHYKKDVVATRSVHYWDEVNQKADIVDIIALHEQNVDAVFEHGLDLSIEADMKDWLLAVRHKLIDDPYSVEDVLRRVRQWHERAKSPHSIYYMYVLTTILALGIGPNSGSRESFAEVNKLKPQLKIAASKINKPKICREWLGSSQNGIQCLIHKHCLGDWDHETRFWRYKERYTLLTMRTGTIRKAENEAIGTIEMDTGRIRGIDGILVVFVPIVSGFFGRRFEHTRVEFFLGFSFAHGCEAFNVTELKRYPCNNCGSKVEISMLGKQVVHCKCGYPVRRRNKAAVALGSTEEDMG